MTIVRMPHQLVEVFKELGLSQYLEVFLDQGFDTWETILDITESDLDALGVKLGHRRKLQRRIANTRGLAADAALISPTRSSVEEARPDVQKLETPKTETPEPRLAVATKRKYRRHPKPDENAPERPPSAYVLFSNKMRDDLKSRNLTFTEIAKLVGENWQNLGQPEKEPFESQAQSMKDKYNHDLSEYKKTTQYRSYMVYLQEFKAKHPSQPQEKDASKRVKLSDSGNQSSSSSTTSSRPQRARSNTASGSEPPLPRDHRASPNVPMIDSPYAAASHFAPLDEPMSPPHGHRDGASTERFPSSSSSPREVPLSRPPHQLPMSSWEANHRPDMNSTRTLPPLSDVLEDHTVLNSAAPSSESKAFHSGPRRSPTDSSAGPTPGLVDGVSRPSLRPEYSSTGSTSSSLSYPRTPLEGSLPIHALLSGKTNSSEYAPQLPLHAHGSPLSPENAKPTLHQLPDRSGFDNQSGSHHLMGGNGYFTRQAQPLPGHATVTSPRPGATIMHSPQNSVNGSAQREAARLDGLAALLQAGEIVDRRMR